MNKQEIKRYLISSLITFVAVFLLTVLPDLSDVTLESIKSGAFLSVLAVAMRVAVKAAVEVLIPYIKTLVVKE